MDRVQSGINELFKEMEAAMDVMIVKGETDFDWSRWISTVEVLRKDLTNLLGACRGRFDSNINTVGEMTDKATILASLRQLEQIINR